MEACPSDLTLASFVDGQLDGAERGELEGHLDRCPDCREVVSFVVAGRSGTRAMPVVADGSFEPDAEPIGRFVPMGVLGRGAMGVVYRAHDPALDRDVALKLLRDEGIDEAERSSRTARLEREARAVARVRHPNVIAVYDVTRFQGRVFIAMELVEGETLASFLDRVHPDVDDTLRLFGQAGRGLAAAHAAGVVHRDFKPENVLVGHDGRVVVTDFGLATAGAEPEASTGATRPVEPTQERLTRTGATLGTPAYMAPEQARGEMARAESDQYSFCVALWEALVGALPPRSGDAPATAPVPSAAERRLPRRVRRALRRGLSAAPEARYPTMEALLGAIAPRRRRGLWLALPALALAGTAAAFFLRSATPSACATAEQGLDATWNDSARARVDAAFAASGKPWAHDTAAQVDGILDGYVAAWRAAQRQACEVRQQEARAVAERRRRCLETRRREVQALVALLGDGTTGLERAVSAARGLSEVARCSDVPELLEEDELPLDGPARAEADAVEGELAAQRSRVALGGGRAAIPDLQALVQRARALAHPPTLAHSLFLFGYAQATSLEPLSSEPSFREAARVADAAGDDETRARAFIELARLLAYRTERHADAAEAIETAAAAIRRMGGSDTLESRRLDSLAISQFQAGHVPEAIVVARRSLELRQRTFGPESPEVAEALDHLGNMLCGAGKDRDAESVTVLQRALTLYDRLYGAAHPSAAVLRFGLARAELLAGHFEESVAESRRALPLMEAAKGADHPNVAYVLSNLASGLDGLERYAESLPIRQRALQAMEKTLGPKHRETAAELLAEGLALLELGRRDEAAPLIARGHAVLEEILPADHPRRADGLRAMAELHMAEARPLEALPLLEHALQLSPAEGPAVRAAIHASLGRGYQLAHRSAEAAQALALAREEAAQAGDAGLPTVRKIAAWAAPNHDLDAGR